MSAKQIKKLGIERVEVNLEGGLEVTINVEVNQRDPAGITVPYKLLVPKLWYQYEGEESLKSQEGGGMSGISRWFSFKKPKKVEDDYEERSVTGSEGEEEEDEEEEGQEGERPRR